MRWRNLRKEIRELFAAYEHCCGTEIYGQLTVKNNPCSEEYLACRRERERDWRLANPKKMAERNARKRAARRAGRIE